MLCFRGHARMSTFVLPGWTPECKVTLPNDLSKDQLLSTVAFKTWSTTLKKSLEQQTKKDHPFYHEPYSLRSIKVQAVDFFGGGRVGFVKMQAEVSNDKGEKLPGSVLLRGGSVAMLVSAPDDDLGTLH